MPFFISQLRLLGARSLAGLVSAPFKSINQQILPSSVLPSTLSALFGKQVAGGEAATLLRSQWRDHPTQYVGNLQTAMKLILDAGVKQHVERHGADPAKWTTEALRAVYTNDLDVSGQGHARIVLSLDPHPDPAGHVANPGSVLDLVHAMPGGAAEGTNEIYLEDLRQDRDVSGERLDVLARRWPEIVARNAARRSKGEPPVNPVLLMGNSWVLPEFRFNNDRMTTTSMVTLILHSQDGVVPWMQGLVPEIPGVLASMSLHFGDGRVWSGSTLNAVVSVPLFKTVFRTAAMYARFRGDIVTKFGPERAWAGLLDPEIHQYLMDRVCEIDPMVAWDHRVLIAADRIGGEFLNRARLFIGGNMVATLDTGRIEPITDARELQAAVDEGVERSRSERYTGNGVIEPADPGAQVLPTSSAASGNDWRMPDPAHREPLPNIRPHQDALAAAAKRLDQAVVRDQIDKTIRQAVREAIGKLDPAVIDPRTMKSLIDTPQLRARIRAAEGKEMTAMLSGTPEYAKAVQALGDGVAAQIVGLASADPLWRRITDGDNGGYFDAVMLSTAAEQGRHRLQEAAATIQTRLAEAASKLESTQRERAAKQRALDQTLEDLKNAPDGSDLRQQLERQRDRLDREIAEVVEAEREVQSEHEADERAQVENEKAEEAAAETQREMGRASEERGREVFGERVLA